jgi:3-phenylpropionate/trans-cinnamate dioxygenase ferredoxin reductase component
MRIVVIGGGQAAASAIRRLRQLGYDGDILLVSREPFPPYERPPLSKSHLAIGAANEPKMIFPEDFWEENAVDLRLSEEVQSIDVETNSVLVGTKKISFDHLILATGASPRKFPDQMTKGLNGTHQLRNVADANRLRSQLNPGRSLVLVGGGFIGMELAATARQLGLTVTVIERDERILNRVASTQLSNIIRQWHLENDVTLIEGQETTGFLGTKNVTGVQLSNGAEVCADLVVLGIGVIPDCALANAAGLQVDNGVLVDDYGSTNRSGIWAAGDCASFSFEGRMVRLENVQNAIDQAENVAENILGANKKYTPTPTFWSNQYDHIVQIVGLYQPGMITVCRQSSGRLSFWHYSYNNLKAVEVIDDPKTFAIARRLLTDGRSPAPELVADDDRILKEFLRSA